MENAAKALTMAGAVLITLMVISAFIFMFRDLSSVKSQDAENQEVQAITQFNKSYQSYEKKLWGTELLSLANKMWDYNQRVGGKDGYDKMELIVDGNDVTEGYAEMLQKVEELKGIYKSSDIIEKINDNLDSYSVLLKIISENNILVDYKNYQSLKTTFKGNYENYYSPCKELKNKKFKYINSDYSNNGRIKIMEFKEI